MAVKLTSESTFKRVVDTVLSASSADDTVVNLRDSEDSTLRFANNQVVQNVAARNARVSVEVAFGQKAGSSGTNRLDEASLREAVKSAERIARLAPDDPEYMSPLFPQSYMKIDSYNAATAGATPADAAALAKPVIDKCERHELVGAGVVTKNVSARGVAASTGLFAYDKSTQARFSLTATGDDSSGWALNAHRDVGALGVTDRANSAIDKAIASRNPRDVPASHYPVILEPAAVAGILGPFFWGLGAKSYYRGNSPFVGKLGSVVLDSRLNIKTDPSHRDLLGSPFGGDGMAVRKHTWLDKGVLKQLYYDRFTAKEHQVDPTPWPSSPIMTFTGPTVATLDDLIAQTERAILVTNFWYIRSVDQTDLTVTGMTRDGTFLVEDGRIVAGVKNFRFHDSPLRCLQLVNAATPPQEAITMERGKMLLPALRLPDFNFSSATLF